MALIEAPISQTDEAVVRQPFGAIEDVLPPSTEVLAQNPLQLGDVTWWLPVEFGEQLDHESIPFARLAALQHEEHRLSLEGDISMGPQTYDTITYYHTQTANCDSVGDGTSHDDT